MVTVKCEIQWLVYLLKDFKVPFEQLSFLSCDNDSARFITTNPVFHEHTKHIKKIVTLLERKIEEGSHPYVSIPTKKQVTDIYTKVLTSSTFQEYLFKFGWV